MARSRSIRSSGLVGSALVTNAFQYGRSRIEGSLPLIKEMISKDGPEPVLFDANLLRGYDAGFFTERQISSLRIQFDGYLDKLKFPEHVKWLWHTQEAEIARRELTKSRVLRLTIWNSKVPLPPLGTVFEPGKRIDIGD